ncbi:MAG: DUF805 domain-containing protein [Tahibacter sp.]
MNWGQLLFSFDGRVGRGVYWGFFVVMMVLMCVILGATLMPMYAAMSSGADPATAPQGGGVMGMIGGLLGLAMIWPGLAISAKRWHDVDKSAWWILIGLVPAVGGIIALVFNGFVAGTPGPNRFGNPPN